MRQVAPLRGLSWAVVGAHALSLPRPADRRKRFVRTLKIMMQQDSQYSHRPWQQKQTLPWQPPPTHEQEIIRGAMAASSAYMDPESIRGIRPPLPQVQFLPDRFTPGRGALTLMDVLNVNALYPESTVVYAGYTSGNLGPTPETGFSPTLA